MIGSNRVELLAENFPVKKPYRWSKSATEVVNNGKKAVLSAFERKNCGVNGVQQEK